MKYLSTISYDGTLFFGYQKQPKERTVQSELEKALKEINGGKKVEVHGSGRTDAKVHAMAQKIHYEIDTTITEEKLTKALNSLSSSAAVSSSPASRAISASTNKSSWVETRF